MTAVIWYSIGFVGQALYGARMIVQWWISERQGRSVVPASFWYLSVVASVLMLAYAVWRVDPVFVAGQILGLAIYLRNLSFLRRPGVRTAPPEHDSPSLLPVAGMVQPRQSGCTCPCTCGNAPHSKAA